MLQEQGVDAHTFQMIVLYCLIWGPPPDSTTWYMVFHDAGEGDAGDIQFNAKRRFPKLKEASDEAEAAHLELLMSEVTEAENVPPPTRSEWARVKVCDLLEGLEYSLTDVAMGNRLAGPVVNAYAAALAKQLENMPTGDRDRVARYRNRPYGRKLWGIYQEICT